MCVCVCVTVGAWVLCVEGEEGAMYCHVLLLFVMCYHVLTLCGVMCCAVLYVALFYILITYLKPMILHTVSSLYNVPVKLATA